MKKFTGVLFCTDLDGTLYADDKTVAQEDLAAIDYFRAEGGLFTFITGRPPQIATDICRTIRPNAPYGCLNGAGIFDPATQQYLFTQPLAPQALPLIRAVEEQMPDVGIQINTSGGIYFCRDNVAMEWFRRITGAPNLVCQYDAPPEPILKVVFSQTEEERMQALIRLLHAHPLAQHCDFIRSEKYLYEILPRGASKGGVLSKMAALLSVRPERTIAVGDYNNDVSMLQAAGLSFAVANAVPEAKAAADHITVSNNAHAIAAIIDGLDRGIYTL